MMHLDAVLSGAARWLLAVAVLFGAAMQPVLAQDGGAATPTGTNTVHIVQRDENLFRIALRYGTTVEAIAEANGLTDVRVISVGQRLLIPNAQPVAGTPVTHIVGPGDTLEGLLARYQTTREALAAANNLCNPALLYIGQPLIVPQGAAADSSPSSAPDALHTVRPGQNIFRLAIQYGTTVNELVRANQLEWPAPVFFGQTLRVPDTASTGRTTSLPYPLTDARFHPLPVTQGKTLSIALSTDSAATVSGTFLDRPLRFASSDGTQHYALFGVHATTSPGIYPLTLSVETPGGQRTEVSFRVQVQSGGYQTEQIFLATEQEGLLDPTASETEDARVAHATAGFSATRHFDGLMALPSTGAITSQFGTRRSYNHGALSNFHTGTDFGAGPNTQIVAPAAGVVVIAEPLAVRVYATIIDHGWGVYSGFWHQSEIRVNVGDVVTPGQVIGLVGSTGRSTGPHLHWELWVGGVQVDPLQWVQESFP